ncbi:MAG: type VII toxin-antitoxin system MntA family adenylyltransferase antitoxin [Myxococcota bacterium]
MADSATSDDLLEAIRRALAAEPSVQAALLFGSHARGAARPDSDIDVAVLLDVAPEPRQRTAQLRKILEAVGRELAVDRVDLVILNDAPPKLAFRALAEGRVAFTRNLEALHRFRVRTYSRHADYEPVERFFRDATRRRALEEAPSG